MSILGNIIAALIPPPVTVSGDAADNANANNDFTGSGLASDRVTFDATKNLDEKFGAGGDLVQDYSKLDGGLGIDTLTIKLTHSQYAALKAELCAKIGAVKAGGLSLDELCSLYKIATGSQFVKFDSIGVELKAWECIKFECVNDAPKAVADSFKVKENDTLTNSVATNDSDFNGDTLTYKLIGSLPADLEGFTFNTNGSFTLDANHPSYQSLAAGVDKTFVLKYCVSDGKGGSAEATLTLVVCGTNDAPVAAAAKFHTTEDAVIVKGSVTASDVDLGDTLKFSIDLLKIPAGLTFNEDGSYEFDPSNIAYQSLPEGEVKNIVVEYSVSDGNGGTATSTLTICITGTHNCPIGNILKFGEFDATDVLHEINIGRNGNVAEAWSNTHVDGWTNVGDDDGTIEAWSQAGVSQRTNGLDIDGLFAIETDGYGSWNVSPDGDLVKDHFKATVDAENGKTYKITFNYASRTDWADMPSDLDGFDIVWNGNIVGHFNPDPTHVGWNTAEIIVTGVSGNDVFEIVETGDNDSYGAIIDKIRVTGEMCGDPEVTPQCHPELLANWDFEKDIIGPDGFSQNAANAPDGWINLGDPGNAINVHTASFNPFYGYGDGEKQWFDTAKSPGSAHIGQIVNIEEGHKATLSFSIAKMQGIYQGTPYATDPNAKVQFTFNGVVVKEISVSDLLAYNEFQTFEVEVTGSAGADTFGIMALGQETSYAGFAIDHVSLKTNGTLFSENFEGYTGSYYQDGGVDVFAVVDMEGKPVGATGGWTSTGSNAAQSELGADGYGGIDVNNQSKGFWFDTQNTPGQVNISHNFIDKTAAIAGATAVLSFDIARQNVNYKGDNYQTDPDAKFQIKIDGVVVKEVLYSDLADANQFTHYSVNIPGYSNAGDNHKISLVDASTNSDVTGFSIDNILIKDVTICEPAPHNGALKAEWTFENHTAGAGDEIGYAPTGFWNMDQWAATHSADYLEADNAFAFASNMQVHGADGHRALDTAASPGNIFLQAITQGFDGASMPDLETGKTYHAEVSILKQDYRHVAGMTEAGTDGTDPDAWVSFKFNNTVLKVHANNTAFDGHANEFLTFDVTFNGVAGQDSFFIMSHGTGDDNQGLLIDQIQIHDWIV